MSSNPNGVPVGVERLPASSAPHATELDIERGSDVPISTQIYWQLAYQIESGRLQPGTRLAPVRDLGAALRVNPNTIRAVYRRLADAGYVVGRHGAGTRVVDRPPVRRGSDALAGTTTFHADEAQAHVAGRVPVVAMLVGPAFMSLVQEISALPPGSAVGVVCGSQRGVESIAEVLQLAGTRDVRIISAVAHTQEELERVDREADVVLLSREAIALGLDGQF